MPVDLPATTLCVPTLARAGLESLLASIFLASDFAGVEVEVVLGDQSGTLAPRPGVGVERNHAGGAAAGRNVSAAAAGGEVLVFVDDDCRLAPDYFQVLAAGLAAGPEFHAFAGPTSRAPSDDPWDQAWGALFEGAFQLPLRHDYLRWATSSNLVVRRPAFRALDGFADLGTGAGGEDVDFGLRLVAAGLGPIRSLPGMTVTHAPAASEGPEALLAKAVAYGAGEQIVAGRHPEWVQRGPRTPLVVGKSPKARLRAAFLRGRRSIRHPPRTLALGALADSLDGRGARVAVHRGPASRSHELRAAAEAQGGIVLDAFQEGESEWLLLYARGAAPRPFDLPGPVPVTEYLARRPTSE
jgi:GT2 family glycosyltransferase